MADAKAQNLAAVAAHRARTREVVIPEIVDPERRAKCERDLYSFCQTYFAGRGTDFPDDPDPLLSLPMGQFHREVCQAIQERILYGGLHAEVDPRGYGKDTIACIIGGIWAAVFGHARFVVVAGYEAETSAARIEAIKAQLEINPLLMEDFPEVCAPVRHLERAAQRAKSQLHKGEYTRIEWRKHIVLPTIPGSVSSGGIIAPASVRSSVRGLNINGRRPDLIFVTDPQTDETAKSPEQTKTILRKLNKDFGGLGGRGRSITCIVLATIIKHSDVAHQLVDREKNPQWNGVHRRALISPPKREDLWEEYLKLRAEGSKAGDSDGRKACKFYLDNREQMDEGADVLWAEAYDRSTASDGTQREYSNLQSLYNFIFEWGEEAFQTECQNDPPLPAEEEEQEITEGEICERLSRHPEGVIPDGCDIVVRCIDIGHRVLHDVVIATDERFSRIYVVSYNKHFTFKEALGLGDIKSKGSKDRPAAERLIEATLAIIADDEEQSVLSSQFADRIKHLTDIDGRARRVDLTLVDAGFMETVVQSFCRAKGPRYRAFRGQRIGHKTQIWNPPKGAISIGDNWYSKRTPEHAINHYINSHHWRTFSRERLVQSTEEHGALLLFGDDAGVHKTFAKHMLSERLDPEKNQWVPSKKKGAPNHFWDCVVGAVSAAAMRGASILERKKAAKPKTVSLQDWMKKR